MNTAELISDSPAHAAPGNTDAVWERVWRHQPSVEKDQTLLERERSSPRWRLIVDRLERTFGSIRDLNTIELGSGRGDLSVLLAERGAKVTLFDRNETALRVAARRFERLGLEANLETGDLLGQMENLRGRFDVSCSLGVIEHFKGNDRTAVMAAHHDVLTPQGLAVISVPHARCIPYRLWKAYLQLRGWWPYGMEIPYSKREIVSRAGLVGFARTEATCMGLYQSISDHLGKDLLGLKLDCGERKSRLDNFLGLILLMFAWRDDARA